MNGLNIQPFEFGISFDNFRTMRKCCMIWSNGDTCDELSSCKRVRDNIAPLRSHESDGSWDWPVLSRSIGTTGRISRWSQTLSFELQPVNAIQCR